MTRTRDDEVHPRVWVEGRADPGQDDPGGGDSGDEARKEAGNAGEGGGGWIWGGGTESGVDDGQRRRPAPGDATAVPKGGGEASAGLVALVAAVEMGRRARIQQSEHQGGRRRGPVVTGDDGGAETLGRRAGGAGRGGEQAAARGRADPGPDGLGGPRAGLDGPSGAGSGQGTRWGRVAPPGRLQTAAGL
nr:spidroin-1-like [Aegilops tauschii subsp. strangulata]